MDKFESAVITCGHLLSFAALILLLVPTTGCRICADCEDLAYPAYGGVWQRTRRNEGRVGSVFDPAGAIAFDLVGRDAPVSTDELERQKYKDDEYLDDPDRDLNGDEPEKVDGQERDRSEENRRLRDSELDDIKSPQEKEKELDEGSLEDIQVRIIPPDELKPPTSPRDVNVRIIPGRPMPPLLN